RPLRTRGAHHDSVRRLVRPGAMVAARCASWQDRAMVARPLPALGRAQLADLLPEPLEGLDEALRRVRPGDLAVGPAKHLAQPSEHHRVPATSGARHPDSTAAAREPYRRGPIRGPSSNRAV